MLFIMAAIAIAAGWNFIESKKEIVLTDLALANVEALAQSEGFPGYAEVYMYWDGGMGGGMVKVCSGSGPRIC